jgi:hypothetical protein
MLASGCACTGDCGSAVSGHYFGTISLMALQYAAASFNQGLTG